MKKLILISIVLISILMFSGCSMKEEEKEVDKATQQKNMTKIQNDISEVIGKNYNEVIDSMGKPYITSYYVNTKNYKEYKSLSDEQLLNKLNIELIYPKEGYESSALYLDIKNNKVVDVKSNEFVGISSGFEDVPDYVKSSNVIIDFYNRQEYIKNKDLELDDVKSYVGESEDELYKNSILAEPNAIAYTKDKDKFINYYILSDDKGNLENMISVTLENNKITDVSEMSKTSLLRVIASL